MNSSLLSTPSFEVAVGFTTPAVTFQTAAGVIPPHALGVGLEGDDVTTVATYRLMRLDAQQLEVPSVTSPAAWTSRVQDALMDAHIAFRSHAMADGVMDAGEQSIDEQFVDTQQIVGEVHEEILEFCHTVRVGKRSAWHDRKRRERAQLTTGQV